MVYVICHLYLLICFFYISLDVASITFQGLSLFFKSENVVYIDQMFIEHLLYSGNV